MRQRVVSSRKLSSMNVSRICLSFLLRAKRPYSEEIERVLERASKRKGNSISCLGQSRYINCVAMGEKCFRSRQPWILVAMTFIMDQRPVWGLGHQPHTFIRQTRAKWFSVAVPQPCPMMLSAIVCRRQGMVVMKMHAICTYICSTWARLPHRSTYAIFTG